MACTSRRAGSVEIENCPCVLSNIVDFTYTVTREFVKQCKNPILILPDDMPPHPYKVAMECAMLAPNAEVSMYPWQEPKERIPLAVRQVHSFLKAHKPGVV